MKSEHKADHGGGDQSALYEAQPSIIAEIEGHRDEVARRLTERRGEDFHDPECERNFCDLRGGSLVDQAIHRAASLETIFIFIAPFPGLRQHEHVRVPTPALR